MATPEEDRLLSFLHRDVTSAAESVALARSGDVPAFAATAELSEADKISALREALLNDPAALLEKAPAALGPSPSLPDALRLLNAAESSLRNAEATLFALTANRSEEPFELPPEHRFPGYNHAEVPIFPNRTQFETTADAVAWATTAAAAWLFRLRTPKPKLPRPATDAVYPLRAQNGETTVALFSDWGTGYSHSQYIVRHIARLNAAQAIHLGDVYYTGTQREFEKQVRPVLTPLLKQMPVYAMNANHEMDSEGIPYLAYLAEKRQAGAQAGFVKQPQETSYFCLANDRYQIVAIDTAFHANGRYEDKHLREWLAKRLRDGAQARRTTILLSQNEPYGPRANGSVAAQVKRPLLEDLREFIEDGLIHLWFWGDEHYAALYEPNAEMPFVGSCIGHGGYPFSRRVDDSSAQDCARVRWAETGSRFEGIAGLREDRGNNGFCFLRLLPEQIELQYIDWRCRPRHQATVRRDGNAVRLL